MSVDHKKASLFQESRKRAEKAMKNRKGNFIQEVKEELKKVDWTSKQEIKTCTKIVVSSIVLFGLGIYVVDLVVRGALRGIDNLFMWIFG